MDEQTEKQLIKLIGFEQVQKLKQEIETRKQEYEAQQNQQSQ